MRKPASELCVGDIVSLPKDRISFIRNIGEVLSAKSGENGHTVITAKVYLGYAGYLPVCQHNSRLRISTPLDEVRKYSLSSRSDWEVIDTSIPKRIGRLIMFNEPRRVLRKPMV